MEPFIENELADIIRITGAQNKESEIKEILEMCYKFAYKKGNNDALKKVAKLAKDNKF